MAKVNEKTYKFFKTKLTSVDVNKRQVTFCFSDDQVDRAGEIVDQSTWDTKNYDLNPIILWGHDPKKSENVLGSAVSLELNNAGKSYVTAQFDEKETNENADRVFRQVVAGTLRCTSAGFIPHSEDMKDGTPILKDNELMEISIVPIPANPRAIALAYEAGSISRKDAKWLMESMRSESDFIEKQMAATKARKKEPTMDEATTKQLTAMMDAVTTLAKTQQETNKELKAVSEALKTKGAVSDILDAEHGWEVSEEKWENMDDVAEIYYAFCEAYFYTATPVSDFKTLLQEFIDLLGQVASGAYAEKQLGDGGVAKAIADVDRTKVKSFIESMSTKTAEPESDTPDPADPPEPTDEPAPEADPPAEDDDSKGKPKKSDDEDDPAKGGDNDQPGAEDGQIDDDTELTPELQAELDAEFEAREAELAKV